MLEYVHFVPGRLRLKRSELRNQSSASEAEAYIKTIPGVTGAAANPATGSLTINFDKELPLDDLWECLREKGYVSGRIDEPCAVGQSWMDSVGVERFGRAVTAALLDAVMRHSAQALVRALL
jgi:copper chaperone CopZ